MALDTPQKRMSVFSVSGIMTPPFPNGSVDASDRVQMSDQYAGIAIAFPAPARCTDWVPAKNKSSTWKSAHKNTSTWKREKGETQVWKPEQEIIPCPN